MCCIHMYLCDTYECIGRMCSCLYVIHEAHVHVVIAKTFNLEPGHQGFNDFGRFPLNFSHGFLRFRGVFVLPFNHLISTLELYYMCITKFSNSS